MVMRKLMTAWNSSIRGNSNQMPFNQVFRDPEYNTVNLGFMPFERYPPGVCAEKSTLTPNATVLLANWIVGVGNKRGCFDTYQRWKLDRER